MHPSDATSYGPNYYLPVVSKLLDRIVAKQLLTYLDTSQLMPQLQSAYRPRHSTETAVTKVLGPIGRFVCDRQRPGTLKMRELKMQEWKTREQVAGVENARVEKREYIARVGLLRPMN